MYGRLPIVWSFKLSVPTSPLPSSSTSTKNRYSSFASAVDMFSAVTVLCVIEAQDVSTVDTTHV